MSVGPSSSAASPTPRNPGGDLDLDWVLDAGADEARAATLEAALPGRSILPPQEEISALLRATGLIDLTTLSGDDTPARVRALCERAREPLPPEVLAGIDGGAGGRSVAAVCIYPHFIPVAVAALSGRGIPIATVAAGFPHGLSPLRTRVAEVREVVEAGAEEVDVVINRSHALTGAWDALHAEVRAFREACGDAHLKVILATGELGELRTIARASRVCLLAGADFLKTSTGKEAVNATFSAGVTMLRAIREYRERSGAAVGFKPAGGIRTPAQALQWMELVREELGEDWVRPERLRLGASSLLDEIVTRLRALSA